MIFHVALFLTQEAYVIGALQGKYLFSTWVIVCHFDFHLCEERRTSFARVCCLIPSVLHVTVFFWRCGDCFVLL